MSAYFTNYIPSPSSHAFLLLRTHSISLHNWLQGDLYNHVVFSAQFAILQCANSVWWVSKTNLFQFYNFDLLSKAKSWQDEATASFAPYQPRIDTLGCLSTQHVRLWAHYRRSIGEASSTSKSFKIHHMKWSRPLQVLASNDLLGLLTLPAPCRNCLRNRRIPTPKMNHVFWTDRHSVHKLCNLNRCNTIATPRNRRPSPRLDSSCLYFTHLLDSIEKAYAFTPAILTDREITERDPSRERALQRCFNSFFHKIWLFVVIVLK